MPAKKIQRELDAIAEGQKFHDNLIRRLGETGLVVDVSSLGEDFLSDCIEGMRWAVSYKQIDEAARELYGEKFEGISICDAHRRAKSLATERHYAEVERLTGRSRP